MNIRMLPPPAGLKQSSTIVNGRTYVGSPGIAVDIPDFDADVLGANGWTKIAPSGSTAVRPTTRTTSAPYIAGKGFLYFDTDLGKLIAFDGAEWCDPATGATV